jgi:hypothetical protein
VSFQRIDHLLDGQLVFPAAFHAHFGAFGGSVVLGHMRHATHRIGDNTGKQLLLRIAANAPANVSMGTAISFVLVFILLLPCDLDFSIKHLASLHSPEDETFNLLPYPLLASGASRAAKRVPS